MRRGKRGNQETVETAGYADSGSSSGERNRGKPNERAIEAEPSAKCEQARKNDDLKTDGRRVHSPEMHPRRINALEQILAAVRVAAARGGMAKERQEHHRRGAYQNRRKRAVVFLLHVDERSGRVSERGRHSDRSVRKSREAIVATFNGLVLNGHYAELGIRDLARKAGVGRSTFYAHFDDKTALLVESMYPLLSVLADAVAGKEAAQLPWALAHFEEQRANALVFFRGSRELAAIESSLANLIAQHLPRTGTALPRNDVASTLSRTTIGLIGDWLVAEPRIGHDELAAVLRKTTQACRRALVPSKEP